MIYSNLKMMNYQEPKDQSNQPLPSNSYTYVPPINHSYPNLTQQPTSYPPSSESKMHDFRNFVGMMLQELRYSCQVLRQQFYNDKTHISSNISEMSYALQELNEKLNEGEGEERGNDRNGGQGVSSEEFMQLIQQNQMLNREIERFKRIGLEKEKQFKEEIDKVQQESYQTFQENFILNQKIVNLQTELESKTNEQIEDLKKDHQNTIIGLNNQLLNLQQNLREKDESIAILEKLVKDYESQPNKSNIQPINDHSKIINMYSLEFQQSKRNEILRSEGYKQSMVRQKQRERDRYEIKRQDPKRYTSNHSGLSNQYGQMRSLDTSNYAHLQSPTHNANQSQFISSFSNYRQNHSHTPSIHSNSGTRIPSSMNIHNQFIYQNQNENAGYVPRSDAYYSTGQYQSNQQQQQLNNGIGLPPRGSRVGQKGETTSFYSSYAGSSIGQGQGRGREGEGQRDKKEGRSQVKRHASRESRHQQSRQSKVDLAKIEQELEGLAKELKSELASISKKKI